MCYVDGQNSRLALASFQLPFGRAYSVFPARPVMLTSLAGFVVGNVICASAQTSAAFIIGRGVTGFATGGVLSGCFAMIVLNVPPEKRPLYNGLGGAMESFALVTSPLFAGLLVDQLSWRWCFYIQIPLSTILFCLVSVTLKSSGHEISSTSYTAKFLSLDPLGTILLAIATTSLIIALQWAGIEFAWSDWRILTALICSFFLTFAFAWSQSHWQDRAILPSRIVLRRSISMGLFFSFCSNGTLAVVEYFVSLVYRITFFNLAY